MKRPWMAMAASVCALVVAPSTALAGEGGGGTPGGLVKQTQTATNENSTEQTASSNASSRQSNVYVPITVLSPGSNNGDVHQSNSAENEASSANGNETAQENRQRQDGASTGAASNDGEHSDGGDGGSKVDQSQSATNDNETTQTAKSSASSKQTNVYVPVAVLSPGSNNGDVHQSNRAENEASSENNNSTAQSNEQKQGAAATGVSGGGDYRKHDGGRPCGGKDRSDEHKRGRGGPKVDQRQSGSNDNYTSQSADSTASSKQTNFYVPIAFLSPCSNGGDVEESNGAENTSFSANNNDTEQEGLQDQRGVATAGRR